MITNKFKDLKPWSTIRNDTWRIFHDWANVERIAKVLDQISVHENILELGCGYGYLAGVLIKNRDPLWYVGVDIDPKAILSCNGMLTVNKLSGNNSFILGDAIKILNYAQKPSVVLCVETLEHVADYNSLIHTAFSFLDSTNRAIISVPRYNIMTKVKGHINNFKNDFFPVLFEKNNFQLINTQNVCNMWNSYTIKRH